MYLLFVPEVPANILYIIQMLSHLFHLDPVTTAIYLVTSLLLLFSLLLLLLLLLLLSRCVTFHLQMIS
jgi:hypothetical protein